MFEANKASWDIEYLEMTYKTCCTVGFMHYAFNPLSTIFHPFTYKLYLHAPLQAANKLLKEILGAFPVMVVKTKADTGSK